MNKSLPVKIKNLVLKTPLLTSSGTSGSRDEINLLQNRDRILASLGAFVTKGVSLNKSLGNKEPRIVEVRSGILNSIGLQNKGVKVFFEEDVPELQKYEIPIIVNISAGSVSEFGQLSERIKDLDKNNAISGLEINVSCPNIKKGGAAFGADPLLVEQVVREVKSRVQDSFCIITKLSPNVTDITQIGKAAVNGGTDALSMINTLRGMAIDTDKRKPILGNQIGGLSGPCIKPVGVYMVYECFRKIPECRNRSVPIIGIGGISNYYDVLEYIFAGATATGIGTQWFINTAVFEEIYKDLNDYLNKTHETIENLVGKAHENI
ncbi:MAG: dihydroorotate dehydrogenase [Bacteroidales bacterium]|nr:dihydroorotate dehydrogenase [Bacteroidales bacterium]